MSEMKVAGTIDASPYDEAGYKRRRKRKLLKKLRRKIFPYKLVRRTPPPIATKDEYESYVPKIPLEFSQLPRAEHGLYKLISDCDFKTVLDVGSGSGKHAEVLHRHKKVVTALDFGVSLHASDGVDESSWKKIVGNFYDFQVPEKFDCVWASHVLEHQPDPGAFIRRCRELVKEDGYIAITVPPLKHIIVGGHLTLWNAGLLLYQLVFNGIDCKDAAILTYGYNITIIVQNKPRADMHLDWDYGDIKRLKPYFPEFIKEPFEGQISRWNW
ncbi:class I SAM-dependent methyltransferase [Pseudovibrio sp. SCP19]|uniref:class I SAM-dependent methyltransferase n=1 Tax=Pseudovibrio sp. SCP19 TaxID=3141374 RepID=UPI00333CF1A1